jgi:tRNA(Ile)-lysidine synthase
MIHIQGPVKGHLAVSGGVDSMAVLHLLTRGKNRLDGVVHVHHGSAYADEAEALVSATCADLGVSLDVYRIPPDNEKGWSDARRKIFNEYPRVMTAHHLDDVIEWYVYTLLRYGKGRVTPFQTGNVVHPFRLNGKQSLRDYASFHGVRFCEDPTNAEGHNARSKIRAVQPTLEELAPNLRRGLRERVRTFI